MNYKPYCKIGAVFTILFGTLLHFAYDFLGEKDFVAIFSAVNESTWEHLKLIFFPMIITGVAGYFVFKNIYPNFLCSKTIGIIISIVFIIS